MKVGHESTFAIESGISEAYLQKGFRALGFFVVYVGGFQYGVRTSEATMLACSIDEIEARIRRRGAHTAPFAANADGGEIAGAFGLLPKS